MLMFLGLTYSRGLIMFFLVAPIILARPLLLRSAWWRAAQFADARSCEATDVSDPVLLYFQKRLITIPAICLAAAALATAFSWRTLNIGPPDFVAPKAAIDFVRRERISGNVFNSLTFGGYLIFSGIPDFIDSRTPPFKDDFLRQYVEAVNLVDINKAFQLLDEYKVSWIILRPTIEPLAKALARSALWDEAYSDKYSVVFVRRR
jgi:hypothetical protein